MNDSIDRRLDEACTPIYIFNNQKIEAAVRRNAHLIDANDLENVHRRILKVLGIDGERSSRYFSFAKFKALYTNIKLSQESVSNEITDMDLI
ncbi:hypothetical protein [Sulfurimonas sp. NW9]|uniref:hypothetical protein n=1 Tax=Sulfurimonas sp. NW9 TaxID=2922728 RepID=UPI003DA7B829